MISDECDGQRCSKDEYGQLIENRQGNTGLSASRPQCRFSRGWNKVCKSGTDNQMNKRDK